MENLLFLQTDDLNCFKEKWINRIKSPEKLNQVNPIFIPRNHQIQKVINDAYEGNFSSFHELLNVVITL